MSHSQQGGNPNCDHCAVFVFPMQKNLCYATTVLLTLYSDFFFFFFYFRTSFVSDLFVTAGYKSQASVNNVLFRIIINRVCYLNIQCFKKKKKLLIHMMSGTPIG